MTRSSPSRDRRDTGSDPVARRATLGLSGFAFVGLTVFLAVGAVNSQNNLLFWVFGVAIGGVIVSGIVSGTGLMGVRLRADPPGPAEADRPATLGYVMTSRNRWLPVFAVEIREKALPKGAGGAFLPRLGAGRRERPELVWTPASRGLLELDRVVVESRFPFGLLHKTLEYTCPRTVVVEPARLELRSELVRRGERGIASGQVRRARRGSAGDYYGLREYSPGDARRTISWRASARRGSLLVVEHGEPPGSSLWIWVTRPTHEEDPTGVLRERGLAIGLAAVRAGAVVGRDVGVWIPWAGVRLTPGRGAAFEARVADAMARIDADATPGPDSPPTISGSDRLLVVTTSTTPGMEEADARLDPRAPESWLGPGAVLPPSLRGPAEVGV